MSTYEDPWSSFLRSLIIICYRFLVREAMLISISFSLFLYDRVARLCVPFMLQTGRHKLLSARRGHCDTLTWGRSGRPPRATLLQKVCLWYSCRHYCREPLKIAGRPSWCLFLFPRWPSTQYTPVWKIMVSLKACRSDPLYGPNVFLLSPRISKVYVYMMSHEIYPSMRIVDI